MFYFAALVEHPEFLYNKLKTRGDGEAVGVGVATPHISYNIQRAKPVKAKPLNVPMFRDHISHIKFPLRIPL